MAVPVTQLPDDAQPVVANTVTLSDNPGEVIEIVTASGSKYWIVPLASRTKFVRNRVACVRGLSITTTSKTVDRFTVSPSQIEAVDVIRTREPWRFGDKGSTSNVRSIRIL